MSILSKFFGSESSSRNFLDNESAGKLMLMGILVSCPTLFNDNWTDYTRRKGQTFEVIIFSTLIILRKFRKIRPSHYSKFEEDIFNQIHNFARKEQIISMLPCDFSDFINSRFILYDEEFSFVEDEAVKFPAKTVYNLFEKPLQINSGVCEDLFKIMEIQVKFHSFFEELFKNFDLMILKKYS